MSIEVITIGSEILKGMITNTNAQFISDCLFQKGWKTSRQTTIPDDFKEIETGLKEALSRSKVVIVTGGLGPTLDDMTKKVAASLFDSKMHFNEDVAQDLEKRYGKSLLSLENQATVPEKANVFLNTVGTAPGLVFHNEKNTLMLFPGVPHEMKLLFQNQGIPFLEKVIKEKKAFYQEKKHFCLLTESEINPLLCALSEESPFLDIGIYPSYRGVTVALSSPDEKTLNPAVKKITSQFSSYQFFSEEGKIEEALYNLFIQKKKTLAFAESCTGGQLAGLITSISGASQYFLGSLVTYSNELKTRVLGVTPTTLQTVGAVSQETAEEMLAGVFGITKADYGVAVTGIAGPRGGTKEKPVGTIWVAIGKRDDTPFVINLKLQGDRYKIINVCSYKVLGLLYRYVAYEIRGL